MTFSIIAVHGTKLFLSEIGTNVWHICLPFLYTRNKTITTTTEKETKKKKGTRKKTECKILSFFNTDFSKACYMHII